MRYLFLLVLLTACGPDNTAQLTALASDVAQLKGQIAQLQADRDAQGHVLAGLMAAGGGKVPHLVVAATGEDLGPSLGGTVAYNAEAGGTVDFATFGPIYFTSTDCTGAAYYPSNDITLSSDRVIGADWKIYAPTGSHVSVSPTSRVSGNGVDPSKCEPWAVAMPDLIEVIGKTATIRPRHALDMEIQPL